MTYPKDATGEAIYGPEWTLVGFQNILCGDGARRSARLLEGDELHEVWTAQRTLGNYEFVVAVRVWDYRRGALVEVFGTAHPTNECDVVFCHFADQEWALPDLPEEVLALAKGELLP